MKPPPFALAAPQVAFDADHRPRYVAYAYAEGKKGGGRGTFFYKEATQKLTALACLSFLGIEVKGLEIFMHEMEIARRILYPSAHDVAIVSSFELLTADLP